MSTTKTIGSNSYHKWNFYNHHVSTDLQAGKFISSETSLVAAGFPDLESGTAKRSYSVGEGAEATPVTPNQVFPIGLLETIGIQQSKQIQRIFEIGSARSYFIPGRVVGSFNLGRTFFNGVSLLRALYAYVTATGPDNTLVQYPLLADLLDQSLNGSGESTDDTRAADLIAAQARGGDLIEIHNLKRVAGHNDFLIDMTSDLFSRPFGMAIYAKDNFGSISHSFYLENCYVQGHQISISSGSLLIMEGAAAQFERAVPIKMVPLEPAA